MADQGDITFGEQRLKQLFADFKLELFELLAKKADHVAVELLSSRVLHLELWQAAQIATEGTREKMTARQLAVWGLVVALVGAAGTIFYLAVNG